MAKFGTLVDQEVPVLLVFFAESSETSVSMHQVLKDVAAAIGNQAKVIKIDIEKNPELAEALRIKTLPTFIIYQAGEMRWRESIELDANTLISLIKEFS